MFPSMDTGNIDSIRPATEAFRVKDRAVRHQGGRRCQAAPGGRSQVEFQARNTFLSHHCPEVKKNRPTLAAPINH